MEDKYGLEIQEFTKYSFPEFVTESLREYYVEKQAYIGGDRDCFIHSKYDLAYTSLKSQWVCGKISEQTFWRLIGILKRGVIV